MSRYFNTLPTSTLNAMLAGWEREFDRTAAGDIGTLSLDYLTRKMHDIRLIIDARDGQERELQYMNRGTPKRSRKAKIQ